MLPICCRRFRRYSSNFSRYFGTKMEIVPKALTRTWTLGKLNHVAIACPDLEKASNFYANILNATVSEPQNLVDHGVTTVFVELQNLKLELLHPLGGKSPISKFLEKNKDGGMHHVCFEVENLNQAIEEIKSKNIRTLTEEPKIGAHGKPVIFLHPKDCHGVLIELQQG